LKKALLLTLRIKAIKTFVPNWRFSQSCSFSAFYSSFMPRISYQYLPWLQASTPKPTPASTVPLETTLKHLSEWQACLVKLSQVSKSRVSMLFGQFDDDADGYVTRDQLKLVIDRSGLYLDKPDLDALVQHLDQNKDNRIDYSAFIPNVVAPSTPGASSAKTASVLPTSTPLSKPMSSLPFTSATIQPSSSLPPATLSSKQATVPPSSAALAPSIQASLASEAAAPLSSASFPAGHSTASTVTEEVKSAKTPASIKVVRFRHITYPSYYCE
jgi:hypothetical protein